MSRARTLADVVPLAAIEPDGLMVTSAGDYVRSLALARVLQPLAGGPAHRDGLRDRLGALAAAVPAGQSLQVLVEAEPLDAERVLARDWREITAATGDANGDKGALRRLGYGLEQSIRASAPVVDAAELGWSVATRWRPARGQRATGRRSRSGTAVLARAAHEAAAEDSLQLTNAVRGDLEAAGADATAVDGAGALAALARAINPSRDLVTRELASVPQVLDCDDPGEALAHRDALLRAIGGDTRLRAARDVLERATLADPQAREVEAVLHLSSPPGYTSPWWLLGLLELPAPWRLSVHVTATDRVGQRRRFRRRYRRLWADRGGGSVTAS